MTMTATEIVTANKKAAIANTLKNISLQRNWKQQNGINILITHQ